MSFSHSLLNCGHEGILYLFSKECLVVAYYIAGLVHALGYE